jgi:hypothetical protein
MALRLSFTHLLDQCPDVFTVRSGIDAGIKMRPNAEDLKEIGPMFDARWKSYFADAPDKPVVWINPLAA